MGVGGTHRISWDLTDITKGDVLPAVIDDVSATIRAKVVRSDEDGLGDHRLAPRIRPTRWRRGARGEIERQEFDAITRLESPKKRKSDFSSSSFFFFFPFSLRGKEEEREGACMRVLYNKRSHTTPPPPPLARMARHPLLNKKVRYIYEKTHLFVGLAEGTLLERLTNIFAPAREEPGTDRGIVHEDDFSRRWLDDDHARRKEKIVRPETAVRDRRRRICRVGPSSNSSSSSHIVSGSGCGSALWARWHRMYERGRVCVGVACVCVQLEFEEKKGTKGQTTER